MSIKPNRVFSILALSTVAALTAYAPVSQAFNFGNMMNPSRWMGGDDDRRDGGPYGEGPYGSPYGGYGYPGAYGAPYGMPYGVPGFGMPPTGYGAPAYGGAPAVMPGRSMGAPAPAAAAPQNRVDPAEVEALRHRVEELEARQRGQQHQQAPEWPSAPAFRPMNQY